MPVSRPYWDEREMINDNERPDILAIGDSWFWYPFNNLLNPIFNIWGNRVILALGENGAEAVDYVGSKFQILIEETLEYYKGTIKMVIVSGGGNDFAGIEDFDLILKDDCSKAKTVAECFESGQPGALFDTIENAYRMLIRRIHKVVPEAMVVTHNYDYAVPSGVGLFGMGNWLKKPMDNAKVKRTLQAPLVNALIDQLGRRQHKLASQHANVYAIKSAGTLSGDEWANELHPTPLGFEKIGKKKWKPLLRKLLP